MADSGELPKEGEQGETAQGSLAPSSFYLARAGLRVAAVWTYITERDAEHVDAMLDVVAAATYRRLHPRR